MEWPPTESPSLVIRQLAAGPVLQLLRYQVWIAKLLAPLPLLVADEQQPIPNDPDAENLSEPQNDQDQ